jgi:hypothetical protein
LCENTNLKFPESISEKKRLLFAEARAAFINLDRIYDFSKELELSDVVSLHAFLVKHGDLSLSIKFSDLLVDMLIANDFVDEYGNLFQLKCLTAHSLDFRPPSWRHKGSLVDDPLYLANYCYAQTFIIADIRDFPKVKFMLVSGKELHKNFPTGRVSPAGFYKAFPNVTKPVFLRKGLDSLKAPELDALCTR